MSYIVVIPARYQSTRLPGKPLINLCGVPMIVRTYNQCIKFAPADKVCVATDSQQIKDVCEQNGIRVVMTSENCMTGTDRVAEVAEQINVQTYINVQGDEPVFNPDDLRALVQAAEKNPDEVINGYCSIQDEEQFRSHSIPKVVLRPDGRLLYMSRAPIPTNKHGDFVNAWRQVCAYAYPRESLQSFAKIQSKMQLEKIEDIEILRFLELGWEVRMISMSNNSVAVDIPEDKLRAEQAISSMGL